MKFWSERGCEGVNEDGDGEDGREGVEDGGGSSKRGDKME